MPKKEDKLAAALADAKRLEDQQLASDKQIAEQYEKDMEKATSAARLLKGAWFVRDAKSRRKTASSKRKK